MSALQDDIDKAKVEIETGKTTDRNSITKLFKENYLVGVNPETNNNIYIRNKDLSYIIYKHVMNGEISYDELKNMPDTLNYDILAKNDNQQGFRFYKKSFTREGYYELATKTNEDEEIIHFQYLYAKRYSSRKNSLGKKNIDY